jgi:DNA-directed RNA polymerase specialized sigma24 family protein
MSGGVSAEAFERLLSALDADRNRAADAYEHLRERTIGLLRWWGAVEPEELADTTLDRVARKLDEGAIVGDGSLPAYVRGVARMIFYESRRRPQVQVQDLAFLSPPPSADVELGNCLDGCLNALSPQDRRLVLHYYGEGKAADVRRRLAAELSTTVTALRIKAHRIRVQLERCVTSCMTGR